MRAAIATALIGLTLGTLAACSKPGPAAATSSSAAPGPLAAGPLTPGQAPHRKPGLWRQVMAMDGAPPAGPGMQLCVDEASEAKMSAFAQQMPRGMHCPPAQFTRNVDGSISFQASCDAGAYGKSSTSGVIRGDFNSSYTAQMDTVYSGNPVASLNGPHKMTISATWLGPCAPGQRGGDLILANGMKRNVLDDQAARTGGAN